MTESTAAAVGEGPASVSADGSNALNCTTNPTLKQSTARPFVKRAARLHEKELFAKLEKAHAKSRGRCTRHPTLLYLDSFACKLVAVERAFGALKPHRKPPRWKLREIAEGLNPFTGTAEHVVVHFKKKEGDPENFRPIMDFGIENKALQLLTRRALVAQANLRSNQFAVRSGMHAAVRRLKHILDDDYCWFFEIDIIGCYQSFGGAGLPDLLPIPKKVIERVILSEHLNLVPGNITHWFGPDDGPDGEDNEVFAEPIAEARLGIPQGSAVSPLVAGCCWRLCLTTFRRRGTS